MTPATALPALLTCPHCSRARTAVLAALQPLRALAHTTRTPTTCVPDPGGGASSCLETRLSACVVCIDLYPHPHFSPSKGEGPFYSTPPHHPVPGRSSCSSLGAFARLPLLLPSPLTFPLVHIIAITEHFPRRVAFMDNSILHNGSLLCVPFLQPL